MEFLTFYFLACQVRATLGDSGLYCCVCVTSLERQLTPLFVGFVLLRFGANNISGSVRGPKCSSSCWNIYFRVRRRLISCRKDTFLETFGSGSAFCGSGGKRKATVSVSREKTWHYWRSWKTAKQEEAKGHHREKSVLQILPSTATALMENEDK